MRLATTIELVAIACAGAAGCASDDYVRQDGLTLGAGNAIAANTAMQMVDPWPEGVQDTDLDVPAQRSASSMADDAAASNNSAGGAADK